VYEILAQRILWSLPFMIIAILAMKGRRERLDEIRSAFRLNQLGKLSISAFFLFLNWAIFLWAVLVNRVIDAALAYYLVPLLQVILGMLFFKEKLTRKQLISLILASIGIAIQGVALGSIPWLSLSLCVTFCIYGLVHKKTSISAVTGFLVENVLLMIPAIALFIWVNATSAFTFWKSPTNAWLFVFSGPVVAVPLIMFAFGVRRLKFSISGMLFFLVPTLNFLIGVLYGEPLKTWRLISFALIWLSVVIFMWDMWKRQNEKKNNLYRR
jgi:chloramphenicol-sensitive protein RarD